MIWISDKLANRVIRVRLAKEPDAIRVDLDASIDFGFTNTALPCSLDLSTDQRLLVSCFGHCGRRPSLVIVQPNLEFSLIEIDQSKAVSHSCWLPDSQIAFVSRPDAVLYVIDPVTEKSVALTVPGGPIAPAAKGKLENLCLKYVQGMAYSKVRNQLYIADAFYGSVFEIDLNKGDYRTLVNVSRMPTKKNHLKQRSIRGLTTTTDGSLVCFDGTYGDLLRISLAGECALVGSALEKPEDLGCMMHKGIGVSVW